MLAAEPQTSRFPKRLFVRTPAGFMEAIDAVARQHHQCVSDYVRQLLIREMKRAGVRLGADGHVDTGERVSNVARSAQPHEVRPL